MSQTPKKRRRRCGGARLVYVFCGRQLLRCPGRPCEEYRLHRNHQKERSARYISYGPLEDPPGAAVEDMRRRYNEPGHEEYAERVHIAQELLDQGMSEIDVADAVLWSISDLRQALRREIAVDPMSIHEGEAAA